MVIQFSEHFSKPIQYNFFEFFHLSTLVVTGNSFVIQSKNQQTPPKWANNEEIEIFREYLRIPTVQPNPDYRKRLLQIICDRVTE